MILCCGEALIDMLPRTTDSGENAFAPHAGGAVFNTAIALGRLDADAGFFCGLSDDLFGTRLSGALAASNVDDSFCPRSDAPTTLAFVTLEDGQAKYAFYDENTALRRLSVDDLPDLPDTVEALFFGGISLVGEPCGTAFQTLMQRSSETKVTMFDPNIRPSFITDEAQYRTRIRDMMAQADIVKLSDEDLAWLEGDGALADLAHGIIDRGTRLVLITEGAKGATGYTGSEQIFVPARKVDVVDTVGAGDTFNAGVLAGLKRQNLLTKTAIAGLQADDIRAVLDMGIRCAAVTVSRAGANPPWSREL
ncbi:carbohydrate kinase family protein [Litoreibacter roseus]|uniref:Carbohydrate kinase n=1 Tax=Litoreibacter roseus TaxID=2601869 RepID=A0A6N6JK83_9RHOB|nr:carbohydrate kinase [Litoreibacter roseus]GFE65602.1 carbohydrate kinase [Litoreibacter roseus]